MDQVEQLWNVLNETTLGFANNPGPFNGKEIFDIYTAAVVKEFPDLDPELREEIISDWLDRLVEHAALVNPQLH